jgi:hypothetical protein
MKITSKYLLTTVIKVLSIFLAIQNTFSLSIRQEKEEGAKLSLVLSELDPTKKVSQRDFIDNIKYALFKMTRGEAQQVFTFADSNKDELIDFKEWDAFKQFFIIPFEQCDKNKDYILDKTEFEACWKSDPKSKFVEFKGKFKGKESESLMGIVKTRAKLEINFADYIFLRKSLFAWQNCHSSSKYIAKSHFTCALKTAIPQKYHSKMSFDNIFETGIKIANDATLIELDFISYLRVLYFSYVFSIFQQTQNSPYLDRAQFVKSITEDRIPNHFNEEEIATLYGLITSNPLKQETQMNFETFSFFFNLHRLYTKYAISNPKSISIEEMKKLLNDPLVPTNILQAIDASKTNFKENDYLEASLYLQRKKMNEKDFYYSFKALEEPEAKSADVKNEESREFFFRIMSGFDKSQWNKANYYSAFQLSNTFSSLVSDNRYIVSSTTFLARLPEVYDTVHPVTNFRQRSTYPLYKTLPREVYLDLLTFLMLENYRTKVNLITINNNKNEITETQLKIVMKDYGMENIHDDLIDVAKKGYDMVKRRIYEPTEVLHTLIIVHAIADEKWRDANLFKKSKIKKNEKTGRKFPIGNRRQSNSTIV